MRRAPDLAWVASLAAAALLLCAVALINGGPVIYPDSMAYLIDADRLSHFAAPYAVRPVFYGVAVWLLHWGGQYGLALFAQALVVAHLLYLTLRASGARSCPLTLLAVVATLVLLTPVSWHVSHLLPDIFMAVLILALFLLGFCRDELAAWERIYLVLLAAAAASFHLTTLPVGIAIAAVTALAWLIWDRRRVSPLVVVLPLLLSLAGSLGFSYTVWQRLTLTPNSPPHLLARIIADGPGRDFLAARCPAIGLQLCAELDRLPATEDGIIWQMLPSLPTADGKRIKAEAGTVVSGTIAMFPLQVAGHMLANAARQLVTFGSETQLSPEEWRQFQRDGLPISRTVANTLQSRGGLDRPALDTINTLHAVVVAVSLLAALLMLRPLLARRLVRPASLIGMVITGLLANAFVCGAFGGVFARYQGRVIWLLPFAALAAALALCRDRRVSSD